VKIYGCLMALILTCAGCQSGGFTRAQVAALQQEGFSQNSEGWGLGLPNRILFGINDARAGYAGAGCQQQYLAGACAEPPRRYCDHGAVA